MKRRHHTPEQIVRKLREADRIMGEGTPLVEVCKHLEVSEQIQSTATALQLFMNHARYCSPRAHDRLHAADGWQIRAKNEGILSQA